MKVLQFTRIFALMVALTMMSVAVHYGITEKTGKTYFNFLIWNLFLAWLPFIISMVTYECQKRFVYKGMGWFVFLAGLVWLLVFPNAFYISTDLIHLVAMKNTYILRGEITFNYWLDFVLIFLFVWHGIVLGFVSTYQFHLMVRQRLHPMMGWIFVLATSFLAGYGILLGREYRLNSWHVLTNPVALRSTIEDSLTKENLLFCLLFGLVIATVYLTFYSLIHLTSSVPRKK